MQLPFFPKTDTSFSREYLFALEINHGLVQGAVWSVVNNHPQVLAVGPGVSWDDTTEDSLLSGSDQTLSEATRLLDKSGKFQPDKVILGLPGDWLEDEKIAPRNQQLLRSLFSRLALKAMGYVVISEAVVRFIQHTENLPPTAILLGFTQSTIEVNFTKLGRSMGTHIVRRSGNVVEDVLEGLSRFLPQDMLPSRILLYGNGGNLENIRQQLLAHPWQSPQTRLPFLHFPKIELLPPDFSIRAVSLAGGSEAATAIGLIAPPPPPSPSPSSIPENSPSDLGFIESDIYDSTPTQSTQPQPEITPPSPPPPPKFHIPTFSFPRLQLPKTPLFIVLIVVAFFGVSVPALLFLPSAQVILTTSPQSVTAQFDFTIDTKENTVEVSLSDSQSTPSTGEKIIGDPATGTVSIINGTSLPKNFPAGTVLTSTSGLKFTLDSAVQVASASGTADPNLYQPGTATVKITGSQIGSDSNLTAGSQFRVGTFPTLDVVAKNESALSGGTSRQVKAVSAGDITGLRSQLTSRLKSQALDKLKENVQSDKFLLEDTLVTQTGPEEFSHKAGDQADEVTLKLSLKAEGLALSSSEFNQSVERQISSQIPQGYSLSSFSDKKLVPGKPQDGQTPIFASLTATLSPVLDPEVIIKDIAGRHISAAKSYLQNLVGVSQSQIDYSLPIPEGLIFLSRLESHIKVSIQPLSP